MPFYLRRYLIAAVLVVVAGIGWTSCGWSGVLGWGQRATTISPPLSREIETDVVSNHPISMPITQGDWQWRRSEGKSVALFAEKTVTVVCDMAGRTINIERRGDVSDTTEVSILTSTQSRTFRGGKLDGQIVVTLSADDTLLDALAFSRGRFGIEVAGLEAIYPASGTEVSRVIEDCRAPSM